MTVYKDQNGKYHKRLKSLDEPTNIQIADKKKLDKTIRQLSRKSKTYEHNQKILQGMSKKQNQVSIFTQILKTISKIIKFCLKCILFFIIGYIILCIIYALLI